MNRFSLEMTPDESYGRRVTRVTRTENPYGLYVFAAEAEKAVVDARREGYRRGLEDFGVMPHSVFLALFRARKWLERGGS